MDVEQAIRTRRTHKVYGPDPVDSETLDELLELARWAPNHHLTNPWRFRVVGPDTLAKLKQAAGPETAGKLDRAPTLVIVSVAQSGDQLQDEEDLLAGGVAAYIVLLAAHARGLVGYWRTPGVLRTAEGRAAAGLGDDERFVALLYLGYPRQEKDAPERAPAGEYVTYLP
jgi:nitroreductase